MLVEIMEQVWKAYFKVRWNPETGSGGIRLWNDTDGEVVTGSESVPGSAGWRSDVLDVTDYFRNKYGAGVKLYKVETKGDGTTGPSIASAILDLYFTTNTLV